MNQLLDSPLEALAFNYISFGIFTVVNNLWTWVAVVTGTAAISFWRIRATCAATSSCSVKKPDQKPSTCITDRTEDDSRPIPEDEEKLASSALVSAPASLAGTSVSPLVCNGRVTKGGKFKLTVYYEDDGESDEDGETTATEWSDGDDDCKEGSCGEWWESWERVLSVRKGETGWYRYQDLTVINGNVVRLWNESCRRGRYSSSGAVW
ncbi:uncharacterized protein LOC111304154 [Durio zibethinus]|uniref:Uncharacterized protein LOC111304154 n=1 Tax=Durio zibethinus TaxID=66656 RepID=A0A6P5ZV83_DURZI|nr:uncharacterized protein LOC111304154 [Durio zibethinus]